MLEFDVLQSGLVILLLLALGDVLTHFTHGAVPAVLFAGLAYMLCCWAGVLPGDLLESSGLGELPAAVMMMVIVNMGASMDISKFISNWRVALLAVLVFAGQLLALFSVVGGIYGVNTAIGGVTSAATGDGFPMGGMAAALIVQERARSLGYEQIITLSVLIMTTQALVGGPAATLCIKKESARLLASGETLPEKHEDAEAKPHSGERRGITLQYGALLKLYAVSWAASRLGMLTGLPRYVLCLLFGLLLSRLGILGKNELSASKSEGFVFFLLMAVVLAGFSTTTPQMFTQMLPPLLLILLTDLVAITLLSALVGRMLGFSAYMGIALGMNIMIGFPLNMLISQDVIYRLVVDERKRAILMSEIGDRMVICGMISVTFLSTTAASFLVALMK